MQVRLDKIEQIFCINSGDFIPKSRNYECTNGGAVALANIFCWAAALLLNIPYCTFLVLLIKIRHRKTTITTKQNGDLRIVMQIFLQYRLQKKSTAPVQEYCVPSHSRIFIRSPVIPSKFILICLLLSKAKVFTILIKGSFVWDC